MELFSPVCILLMFSNVADKTFSILLLWKGTSGEEEGPPHMGSFFHGFESWESIEPELYVGLCGFSSWSFVSWLWPKIHTLPRSQSIGCTALGFPFLALLSPPPTHCGFSCWIIKKKWRWTAGEPRRPENECRDKDHGVFCSQTQILKRINYLPWLWVPGCAFISTWLFGLFPQRHLQTWIEDGAFFLSKVVSITGWLSNNSFIPPRNDFYRKPLFFPPHDNRPKSFPLGGIEILCVWKEQQRRKQSHLSSPTAVPYHS